MADMPTGRRALLAAALAGCARIEGPPATVPAASATAWLVSLGWHTEVVLAWPAEAALPPPFPAPGPIGVAFGARDYFTAPAPGLPDVLAGLLPGPAVILATPRPALPSGDAVALRVTPHGLLRLARFVAADLARDAAGAPASVARGFSPGGIYLAAVPAYSLAYTCNTWALDALSAAGVPVSGTGILTAEGAMSAARRAARS